MAGVVRIGISGWRYASWRGVFYPKGLPQRRELEYAAERMDSVEINGSFYSLQSPASYRRWREAVPADFVFAVKGGRFITHMRRLRGVEGGLANFFASGLLALGPTLGPVLWQLPERVPFEPDVLAAFFDQLPRTTTEAATLAARYDKEPRGGTVLEAETEQPIRHALEVRHESFTRPEVPELLREHDIGLVVADTAGRWPLLTDVTSDHVYVRLHGSQELYTSGYTDEELTRWADDIRAWRDAGLDVYVYFDNDAKVHAPFDAIRLRELVAG
ncbi:DUF72 domain-containing protein [Desertivibrio insolitus]|uniref:DUF72 domain-containing protein n=1 Tax=Herbiconiux sp. SYSU D00978 TaxID=2812562 RepID=UPI001A97A9B5|nr:DUF72 domain-containing protein [Herbiconiux sp. SYSU D00978]